MKQLVATFLLLLAPLLAIIWWAFRSRLTVLKARLDKAVKVAAVAYLAFLALQLATSGIDGEQLRIAGLSLLFFGGLWLAAWLVTRSMAR